MRLLKRPEVEAKTGLSRSAIYAKIAAGIFPRPVNLGPKAVSWLSTEIDQWICDRVAERDGKAA